MNRITLLVSSWNLLESSRKLQKAPESTRKFQRASESIREHQEALESPREPQRAPESTRDSQRAPERISILLNCQGSSLLKLVTPQNTNVNICVEMCWHLLWSIWGTTFRTCTYSVLFSISFDNLVGVKWFQVGVKKAQSLYCNRKFITFGMCWNPIWEATSGQISNS